ncbi:hypothetical protein AAE021_14300 [Arthrobacter citreus]|uniref:Uncharacterized protein n=1 Tax=Arthrobacter citreus TaxID=1670 RepID=A0ABZ2ZU71_9MICC
MEPETALFIVVTATVVFLVAVPLLLLRFKKTDAEKYPPTTSGKGFEVRRAPKGNDRI